MPGTDFDVTDCSYIGSRGVVTFLPSIKRFGVHPVVSCSADLCTIVTLNNSTSQLVWCSFSLDDNIVANVLFKRSTMPSDLASGQIGPRSNHYLCLILLLCNMYC
jgi:hypothetical protein